MGYEQTSESSFSARRRHLEALRHASASWSTVVHN
jgi:tRNA modification GTPase